MIRDFVGRHDFMEIALSSADFRRIITHNKLAVVLGIEVDNIGNFYNPVDHKGGQYNPNPTDRQIRQEVDRLFNLGVRYVFPIHVTNNIFGGSAIYDEWFDVANKYNTGLRFDVADMETRSTGIGFKLKSPYQPADPNPAVNILINALTSITSGITGGPLPRHIMPNLANYPLRPNPGNGKGHRNTQGLSPKGEVLISHLMDRVC